MRRLCAAAGTVLAGALAGADAVPIHASAPSSGSLVVASVLVRPPVVRLGQTATIAVSAPGARTVEAHLAGATDVVGRPLPWQPLRRVGSLWMVELRAPSLRGIYPVELRAHAGGALRSGSFVRVFARGTRARPAFAKAVDVARWWVTTYAHGTLVAARAWPRPQFDRRDPLLHRLFVVAYSPRGRTAARDRLGMFVEAFRDGYRARWRFLEATVAP